MTVTEVRALSKDKLRFKAAEITRDCRLIFGYFDEGQIAWMLLQWIKGREGFWDFCRWLEKIAGSTDLTVVMGHLTPRMITEAFILTEVNEGESDGT